MIWLILGIMLAVAAFIGLGFKEEVVEHAVTNYRGETRIEKDLEWKWKRQKKQLLSLLCLLICCLGFITKIPANHVGIVYSPFGGTKETTLGEGFNKKNPLDKVYKISTETQTKTVDNLTTQTKDAQYLTSSLDIKYKVSDSNAYMVFKQYRTLDKMSENLIVPTTQRVLELVTTEYNVIDILGEKRSEVYSKLEVALDKELAKYGVKFESITINDMDAGDALEAAITAEAVAKKEVETAAQQLEKSKMDAQQKSVQAQAEQDAAKIKAETKLIEAEAEKKANEMLNQSLSDEILQQQWINKWNGSMPQYYGGDAGIMIGVGGNE